MDRLRRGAGRFVVEFESTLFGILGSYLVVMTAIVCAVCGLMFAGWAWPRVGWVETAFVVFGIIVGGGAGLLAFVAIGSRLTEGGRSRLLWLAMSLIPGAGVPIGIAELVIRVLRTWSERGEA
ncbi:MAG: hypothetical protein KF902_02465 [Phycisphaeraceae bacterium]|nr:hypothetical protein [Phycisphaeraceae bacterium]MCW5768326.1 hypothetical protein [Phycisphaeraceae bacterium]